MAQRDSLHGAMPEFTVPSYLLLRKWTDAASNADNPESLVRGLCGAVIGAGIFDSVCVNVILQEKALRGFMSHGREFDFETISGMPEDSSCASCWALSPGVHDVTSRLPAGLRADYKKRQFQDQLFWPSRFHANARS